MGFGSRSTSQTNQDSQDSITACYVVGTMLEMKIKII